MKKAERGTKSPYLLHQHLFSPRFSFVSLIDWFPLQKNYELKRVILLRTILRRFQKAWIQSSKLSQINCFGFLCKSVGIPAFSVIALYSREQILTQLLVQREDLDLREKGANQGATLTEGVDQVHIYRSGTYQKIRCRSGRGASVRKQTMCGTSGICHYIQTVSYTGQLFPSHQPLIVIIIEFRNPEKFENRCWTKRFPGDETDRLWIINGSIDHFLFLMALDRFERESIKYAKKMCLASATSGDYVEGAFS